MELAQEKRSWMLERGDILRFLGGVLEEMVQEKLKEPDEGT